MSSISPVLCLSHMQEDLLTDPNVTRNEYDIPVVYEERFLAMAEFPSTLFTKHVNHVERGLFLDLQHRFLRHGMSPLSLSTISVENRMTLGHRMSPVTFKLLASDENDSDEIIGIETGTVTNDTTEEETKAHYFDRSHSTSLDQLFTQSWTCPAGYYVAHMVLYRKQNHLVGIQMVAKQFDKDTLSCPYSSNVFIYCILGFIGILLLYFICLLDSTK